MDLNVFPLKKETLSLGYTRTRSLLDQLMEDTRLLNYRYFRLTGFRTTGAKPGKTIDLLFDLER